MNWSSLTHRQVPAWGFFQVFCFGWGFNICMFKCLGLPWGSDSKESACNAGDPGSIPESVRFVWRSKWLPTPAFLPGKSHGQRSLVGYSPCGHKESDTTENSTTLKMHKQNSRLFKTPTKTVSIVGFETQLFPQKPMLFGEMLKRWHEFCSPQTTGQEATFFMQN